MGSKKNIVLIPNGITNFSKKYPERLDTTHYQFVNVARFFPEKNHEALIDAFSEVCLELPSCRLVLVGDGPLRRVMENKVSVLGLSDKVEFLGVRRDVPAILERSDCFVLSSRWELHPITILEAMRSGLPVVATSVGGVQNTVVDGKSGFLVKPGDKKRLAQAMIRLAENVDLGKSMGFTGRQIVNEVFSNKVVAKKIEMQYLRVVGGTK